MFISIVQAINMLIILNFDIKIDYYSNNFMSIKLIIVIKILNIILNLFINNFIVVKIIIITKNLYFNFKLNQLINNSKAIIFIIIKIIAIIIIKYLSFDNLIYYLNDSFIHTMDFINLKVYLFTN